MSGGVPPYTYRWNDPQYQTTDTAVGLCAGNIVWWLPMQWEVPLRLATQSKILNLLLLTLIWDFVMLHRRYNLPEERPQVEPIQETEPKIINLQYREINLLIPLYIPIPMRTDA